MHACAVLHDAAHCLMRTALKMPATSVTGELMHGFWLRVQRLNSATYSKRMNNDRWSAEDTERFYQVLCPQNLSSPPTPKGPCTTPMLPTRCPPDAGHKFLVAVPAIRLRSSA